MNPKKTIIDDHSANTPRLRELSETSGHRLAILFGAKVSYNCTDHGIALAILEAASRRRSVYTVVREWEMGDAWSGGQPEPGGHSVSQKLNAFDKTQYQYHGTVHR